MPIMDQKTERITDYSDGSNGKVVYAESVFHDIAAAAAKEVDGVVSAQIKNIKLNQEDAFTIGLSIAVVLEYKATLIRMAQEMQHFVGRALHDMTGSEVQYVDIVVTQINVDSIQR